MKKQPLLTLLLISQTLGLCVYTFLAFKNDGISLFHIFLSDITELRWSGQFNLDFSCYLTLSGLWVMWRDKFSVTSVLFGLTATILGIIVFAPYLLFLLAKENGDLKKMLIGNR